MGALAEAFDRAAAESPAPPAEERKGSLADEFDRAVKEADAAKKAQEEAAAKANPVPVKLASPPGKLMSAAAGAGEAVGRGALAVQQLLGKGLQATGDLFAPPATTSDLIAPREPNLLQQSGQWLLKDAAQGVRKLAAENAPYRAENPASNFAGAVGGMVFSPINKLIPAGPAATTVLGSAAQGAAQGAALNALSSPVEDDKHFLLEKGQQAAVGGMGGALGGVVGFGLSKALDKGVEAVRALANRATTGNVSEAAESTLGQALSQNGIGAAQLKAERPELFASLKDQVADALKSGKPVDPAALKRLTQAQTLPVPVPMLKGQITREPMQFAKEQNLRGIQGVGEPITQTLQAQNQALLANLDAMGAKRGTDIVSSGKSVIDTLLAADKEQSSAVGAAYKAFKDSTGKDLHVPLTPISDVYHDTVKEFGDAIPSAVRSQFENLAKTAQQAGKYQDQLFSIQDAERLIKTINRNYDPKNLVAARALDDLRKGVQQSISEGAGKDAIGAEAAGLAQTARAAASQRFNLIDATPGLKAAIQGQEPDKFLQKFVLQGNVGEIKNMVNTLGKQDPQVLAGLQDSLMQFIKERVGNQRGEGNATFSSDQLKRFVNDPNMAQRVGQVLGPQRMAQLKQLYQVSENALYAPTAAAVNRSNTASAAANIVKSEVQGGSMNAIADLLSRYVPVLATPAQAAKAANQSARASALVNEAVNPTLGAKAGSNVVRLGAVPAKAVAAALQERNRREAQR